MPTTAELMRKENETLKKAQDLHRTRLKKLEANETKRLFKILKTNNYFDYEFSDEEVTAGIQAMVLMKNPSTVFPEEKNKSSANADKDSKNSVGVKTDKPNSDDTKPKMLSQIGGKR